MAGCHHLARHGGKCPRRPAVRDRGDRRAVRNRQGGGIHIDDGGSGQVDRRPRRPAFCDRVDHCAVRDRLDGGIPIDNGVAIGPVEGQCGRTGNR